MRDDVGYGPCLGNGMRTGRSDCGGIVRDGYFCVACLRRPEVQGWLAEARAIKAAKDGKFAGSA